MSNSVIANHGIRAALLCGACLVAMASVPAVAQQANNEVESVTVTGLISSLQKNLDIKRDAPGLVDAISAEDVGKFPNLTRALLEKGYSADDLRKIYGGNLLRVMRATETEAKRLQSK